MPNPVTPKMPTVVMVELSASIHGALLRVSNAAVVDENALKESLYKISRALLDANVQFNLVLEIQKNMQSRVNLDDVMVADAGHNRDNIVRHALFHELCRVLDPAGNKNPLLSLGGTTPKKGGEPNVVMFVGLHGSGKTASCIKYACYHQKKGWRPAIVCADTIRKDAFDQLKQQIATIPIPCYGNRICDDPVKVAVQGVEIFKRKQGCDLIIVDTSAALFEEEELRRVSEAISPDLVILVVDASVGHLAFDQVENLKKRVDASVAVAVIVTKMDTPRTKGAGALCAVAATRTPLLFTATGEHMNELQVFYVKPFVRSLLCPGALSGVEDKIGQPNLLAKVLQGGFTLRIIYELYQSILNSGPDFENIIDSMGPGGVIPGGGCLEESVRMMKGFIAMMDSMKTEELDSPDLQLLVNNSPRITRIARDSGHQVSQVMEIIDTLEPIAKKISIARRRLAAIGLLRPPNAAQPLLKEEPASHIGTTVFGVGFGLVAMAIFLWGRRQR